MTLAADLRAPVAALLAEMALRELLPRFRNLAAGDIREKAPNDLVTAADLAMEAALTPALEALLPGSTTVGEEAVAADPAVRDRLASDAWVWVIDPLDGTANFARGNENFGAIVALVHRGETVGGWIFDPLAELMASAVKGQGTQINGASVAIAAPPLAVTDQHAALSVRFFPPDHRQRLTGRATEFASNAPRYSAAKDYVRLLRGEAHLALFYRTLPWDHAAGVLLVEEAGGYAASPLTGKAYGPASADPGLLIAAREAQWQAARGFLFGDGLS